MLTLVLLLMQMHNSRPCVQSVCSEVCAFIHVLLSIESVTLKLEG